MKASSFCFVLRSLKKSESKEKIGFASGGRAKGGRARQFWREGQGWQSWQVLFGKSCLASQRRRLVIILAGGPRVAEQDGSGGRAKDGRVRERKGSTYIRKKGWKSPYHKHHHGR